MGEPSLERRVDELEKQVALLDQHGTHLEQGIQTLGDRITGMNDKKLTPMSAKIDDLHQSIYGSKGFWAGVFMTVSALWAVIATFGVVIWQWVKSENGG
jgi:uncharacterized coiled-coil protein SlyX